MDMRASHYRPAIMAAMVGAGVVAGSTVAILVRSWFGSHRRRLVPITILSGFLGAGKTTLLSRLLKNANGLRIAVLVNDLAEVNVDARMLLAGGQASSLAAFSQLENGCLCCSTEADVVGAVTKLLEAGGEFDHLVIECSGMAQPSSLMELFIKAEEEGHVYKNMAMLNQMVLKVREDWWRFAKAVHNEGEVTLVDGRTLLRWLEAANGSTLVNIGDESGNLAELLVEQIECADLIIVSKVDCLQQAQIRKCLAAIRALNGTAVIECASFGDLPPSVIFGTVKGCLRKKNSHSHQTSHDHSHHNSHDHSHHEDGAEVQHAPHVRSFVYKSWCPFQPQRLVVTLRRLRTQIETRSDEKGLSKCLGRGVLRAKGLVWLATDMKRAREWAQVGETLHLHYGDLWKEGTAIENGKSEGGRNGESYGDRRQEIVFIGTGELQEADIRNALDSCLLTSEEMERGPSGWTGIPDPIVITPLGPRHKKPTTHGVGCACCDPELKLIDQAVSRQIG